MPPSMRTLDTFSYLKILSVEEVMHFGRLDGLVQHYCCGARPEGNLWRDDPTKKLKLGKIGPPS